MNTIKVGNRIALLREDQGYSQKRLAELLNIDSETILKWENGHALPESYLLPNLAHELHASIDSILTNNEILILYAAFGDGIEHYDVTHHLNKSIHHDSLNIEVNEPSLACPICFDRPKYVIVKYQTEQGIYYTYKEEGGQLIINSDGQDYQINKNIHIIAAFYGTSRTNRNVMNKIEHYKMFNWNEYHANHELFPSHPAVDDKEYLTFIYLSKSGIQIVTCEESESIAYNADKTEFFRIIK